MMRAYIQSLQRQVEADNAAAATEKSSSSPGIAKTVKHLDQQIVELMRSLPPTLRDRPWSIQDLVNRLEGRYRQRPHAQGVGQALRRLGWVRIRPGDLNGGERRMWIPPELIY
jgi:hypothetical protein